MTVRREPRMPGIRASVIATTGQRQAADQVKGIDGRYYSPATEEKINRLAALVFGNENGRELLEYLKNITINAPFDHTVPNDTLRHMEGQRYIVAVLVNRLRKGSEE